MRKATTVLAALGFGIAMLMVGVGQSLATPAIASKTGQACGKCHTAPPALNAYGKSYKKKMKK